MPSALRPTGVITRLLALTLGLHQQSPGPQPLPRGPALLGITDVHIMRWSLWVVPGPWPGCICSYNYLIFKLLLFPLIPCSPKQPSGLDLDTVNKVDPGIVQINKLQELARPKDFFPPNAYNIKIRKRCKSLYCMTLVVLKLNPHR